MGVPASKSANREQVQCLVRRGKRSSPLGVGPYLLGRELYLLGAAPRPNG